MGAHHRYQCGGRSRPPFHNPPARQSAQPSCRSVQSIVTILAAVLALLASWVTYNAARSNERASCLNAQSAAIQLEIRRLDQEQALRGAARPRKQGNRKRDRVKGAAEGTKPPPDSVQIACR